MTFKSVHSCLSSKKKKNLSKNAKLKVVGRLEEEMASIF